MEVSTHDPKARRVATAVVELVLSELPAPPSQHTELAQIAAMLGVDGDACAGPASSTTEAHDERHPYLAFQHELCISCGRCVRACDEVQGAFALTATGRGFAANIAAGLDDGFRDSTCVSCGACADSCPTDAITEMTLLEHARARTHEVRPTMTERFDHETTTTCGYCGVGCRLETHARNGKIVVDHRPRSTVRRTRATPA